MNKKIVITGASGLIGKKLVTALTNRGDNVIVFTRNLDRSKSILSMAKSFVKWDYNQNQNWQEYIEGANAVVHLAGVNLFAKRWDKDFKKLIIKSREKSTNSLVNVINQCKVKPEMFVSASGVGYYGDQQETILNENSPKGKDFLSDVCYLWESEATKVEESGVRRVSIRTGIVLSTKDGALKQMLLPFKLFVGGPLGNGNQWFPWLHIDDIVGIYMHAIDTSYVNGSINAASPHMVRMKEFAKTLGKILNRPSSFPVPQFVLKTLVGEAAEVVTASQRIVVKKLLDSGYRFAFPHLEAALRNLLDKK